MRSWTHPVRLLLVALALTASAVPALAQTRSVVAGTIMDSTGAVMPGVSVTLASPDLVGGAQRATSNERGEYRFADLPPGTYEVLAELTGFQTVRRPDIRVLFATTVTIDVTMPIGGVQEQTVVVASPVVDVKTAQSTSKIDAAILQGTPIIIDQRNADDAIAAVSPGVTARSAFGGSRSANEVLFDGTPTTLPERQATNGIVINSSWLEELQVVSLGANAEYGEFTGTAANFVTRSGSNKFRGLVEYRELPGSWIGNNVKGLATTALQTRFTPAKVLKQRDGGGQLGGPLVRDRLFFFGGYQYITQGTQGAGAPAPSGYDSWRTIGKLSWAASNTLRVEGTLQPSNVDLRVGPSATTTKDVGNLNHEPQIVWTTRASWTAGSKTLVELRMGGLAYKQTLDPVNGGRNGPSSRRDVVTGITSVNGNTFRVLDENRLNSGGSITKYFDKGLGRHDAKIGFEFSHMSFYQESAFPSGLSFQDRNGVPDQVTIWAGDIQQATGNQTRTYVRDSWSLSDRVTIEPGVRFTMNRGRTPTAGRVFNTNTVSPRIGVAWDVTPSHRTVVRAHYGRFHEAFGTTEFQFTDTKRQTPQITARVLADGSFQEISRFTPAGNQFVDPDIRQAHMDQYLAGVERELFKDFSLNVQYIDRRFTDLFGWLDTGSIYAPVQVKDPGPDNLLNTADDGGAITAFNLTNPGSERRLYTNPDGASRRYRAVQFIGQKRYSNNWQLLVGYTRSKADGNVNNGQGDNYGGTTVTANPYLNPNNFINAQGRNSFDFPDEFLARGSYRINLIGGFNVAMAYRYISGQPLSRTAVFRLTQGNTTIRVEPRGSFRTDATSVADFRIDKTVPLGAKRQLSVYLDVYNINNQGAATGFTEGSGAAFRVPSAFSSPRSFIVSGRLTF